MFPRKNGKSQDIEIIIKAQKIFAFQAAMITVAKMAQDEGRVCYLFANGPIDNLRLEASHQYWHDWVFKAYPGGRKILSVKGKEILQKMNAAEHRIERDSLPGSTSAADPAE